MDDLNINALIPVAEKEANEKVKREKKESEDRPGTDGKPFNWNFFTEYFHFAMNRMAIEAGLRVDFKPLKCQKDKSCVKQPANSLPDLRARCTGCDEKEKDFKPPNRPVSLRPSDQGSSVK